MTKLIEKQENWEWLRWGEGFIIGLIAMMLIAVAISAFKGPETKIVHVPVAKVIEKEVVRKVPVALNNYDKRQILS